MVNLALKIAGTGVATAASVSPLWQIGTMLGGAVESIRLIYHRVRLHFDSQNLDRVLDNSDRNREIYAQMHQNLPNDSYVNGNIKQLLNRDDLQCVSAKLRYWKRREKLAECQRKVKVLFFSTFPLIGPAIGLVKHEKDKKELQDFKKIIEGYEAMQSHLKKGRSLEEFDDFNKLLNQFGWSYENFQNLANWSSEDFQNAIQMLKENEEANKQEEADERAIEELGARKF